MKKFGKERKVGRAETDRCGCRCTKPKTERRVTEMGHESQGHRSMEVRQLKEVQQRSVGRKGRKRDGVTI